MGICAARLFFKEGLPKVRHIKEQFYEITGLKLSFLADLHLNELMTDDREIAYNFYKSQEQLTHIFSKEFKGGKSEAQRDFTSLGYVYFACSSFHKISLDYPEEKSFYLEYSIYDSNSYFSEALIKTMLELGGNLYNYFSSPPETGHIVEDHLAPYHAHEKRWKRIKKWEMLSDFEKSNFRSRFKRK